MTQSLWGGLTVPIVKIVKVIAALLIGFFLFVPHPAPAQELDEATVLDQKIEQLWRQGSYSDAIPLAKRLLSIHETALGPDDPKVATALYNLAELYRIREHYTDAEPLFKRSLAIKEKAFGPDHFKVATVLNNLALLYEDQDRYAEAEPLLKRSAWSRSPRCRTGAQQFGCALLLRTPLSRG
jgi:tetratricopeptide (TPR) repeat protein